MSCKSSTKVGLPYKQEAQQKWACLANPQHEPDPSLSSTPLLSNRKHNNSQNYDPSFRESRTSPPKMKAACLVLNDSNSEVSVNFKHARQAERKASEGRGDIRNAPPLRFMTIDFNPYLAPDSLDTTEQSGHTPPSYNPPEIHPSMIIPSPAREDSTEVLGDQTSNGGKFITDPAELEWLINTANALEEEEAIKSAMPQKATDTDVLSANIPIMDNRGPTEEALETRQPIMGSNTKEIELTPTKQEEISVRRSARITNRSGPVETKERYTIAARRKGLELEDQVVKEKQGGDQVAQQIANLKEEEWERVAEGAGYIISPLKKNAIGAFIKGTICPSAMP